MKCDGYPVLKNPRSEITQIRRREYTGRAISFYRRALNWTQSQLAVMLPCADDVISRIERGIQDPTFQQICLIASCMGITPNDLCSPEWGFPLFLMETAPASEDCAESHRRIREAVRYYQNNLRKEPVQPDVLDAILSVLRFCSNPRSKKENREFCGYKSDAYFRKEILYPLLQTGMLQRTMMDKATSPEQRYQIAVYVMNKARD